PMGVNEWRDRRGKKRTYVTKQWPDSTRFKRVVPNRTVGKKLLARINESIAMGTWRDLKVELSRRSTPINNPTIEGLAAIYFEEHCQTKNRRPDFKKQALSIITRILGNVPVKEFGRTHAYEFISRRSKEVSPATVNRGLAVLKNMMTFALDKGLIESHPLIRFSLLPEPQKALRVMTLEEERHLVKCMAQEDLVIGAYVAILGETALRKSEGLRLQWSHINTKQKLLAVEWPTKSGKIRYVPLTQYALSWLAKLDRIVGVPWVFLKSDRTPWKSPKETFAKGKKAAGLEWVGIHGLRHFRATQWVMNGVDLRTVQGLLGHADLQTTMRYAHFAQSHAMRSVHEVEEIEARQLAECSENGTTTQ
ncbi:site-specific integrase, partial [Acidobacteria bacterium AH-259-O06]|nr:site-specific integrase [Acidobacteria bacterium AH-259-O06]